MGEVYRARDTKLGREVAIKVLPERRSNDDGGRMRLESEARTISQLQHPHVCELHDPIGDGTARALAMKLQDERNWEELWN